MKRYAAVITVIILGCILLGGCGFWMDGDYLSVQPHLMQTPQTGDEVIEVTSYVQIRNALAELVEAGAEGGIMSASSFNDATVHHYMDTAVNHVLQNNPIGAYAVDEITFEIGTNRGAAVVAFQISYRHNRSEILRIKQTEGMEDAVSVITGALDNCDDSVVLYISQYEVVDFTQMVQDYANDNPDRIMEIPHVRAEVYPQRGKERIVELSFTYQTSRETLRQMQEIVEPVFTSAELYVKETTQVLDIYSRLYAFLMERDDYTIQTSITPAYSLLHHGVGDSRAFANVYAVMCRQAGLDCQTVSGTRAGEPWCWNVVRFRGEYYHVDLLQCSQTGGFQMFRDSEMSEYVWDYSAYTSD